MMMMMMVVMVVVVMMMRTMIMELHGKVVPLSVLVPGLDLVVGQG